MGLIIEVLAARRWSHICLFGVGLLLSFSGTGWIVLASFLAGNVARLGLRGIAISIGGVAAFCHRRGIGEPSVARCRSGFCLAVR